MFTHSSIKRLLVLAVVAFQLAWAANAPQPVRPGEELAVSNAEVGKYGGRLALSLRSEPKTFNPVTLVDGSSREITGRLHADLLHINRATQQTEAALANPGRFQKMALPTHWHCATAFVFQMAPRLTRTT